MPDPMTDKPRMTAVFEYDLKQHPGNPFHTDTPFGRPLVLQPGDFSEADCEAVAEDRGTAMTANPFAALRTNIVRAIFDPGTTVGYKGDRSVTQWQTDAVLAALAAAVSDDLAEAGKVLECDAKADPWVDHQERNGALAAWAREGVPALLARIAAMEAQIKGLEVQRDAIAQKFDELHPDPALMARIILKSIDRECAAEAAETALAAMTKERDLLQGTADEAKRLWAESEAALAAITKELETARLTTGLVRMCVNCGATRPADYGMGTPRAGCPSPDACTWDMTPQEAADHWRKIAHDRYAALAAERAKVAKLVEALGDMIAVAEQDEWQKAMSGRQIVLATARAAITEAGQ